MLIIFIDEKEKKMEDLFVLTAKKHNAMLVAYI